MKPIPDHCKDCPSLWTGGIKDGKHDRWCCKVGQPAPKIVNHCIQHDAKPKP